MSKAYYDRLFLVIVSVALATVFPVTAISAAQPYPTGAPQEAPLPDMFRVLLAGWQDNVDSVRTLAYSGTLSIKGTEFEGYKDLDGKIYNGCTAEVSAWKHGANIRADAVFDHTFNPKDKMLVYNVPFGVDIKPAAEVDMEELRRKYGIIQTTYRCLLGGEDPLVYQHESKDVIIGQIPLHMIGDQQCWLPLYNRLIADKTLPEYISSQRKKPNTAIEARELEDGLFSMDVYWPAGNDVADKRAGHLHIVVDSRRGYTVRSIESYLWDKPVHIDRYDYVESGGAWVMAGWEIKDYDIETGAVRKLTAMTIDRSSLKVNEPIDPARFTVDSLGIAKGSLVRNLKTKERHLYNDIPFHLKVALKEAERDMQVLPDSVKYPTQYMAGATMQSSANGTASMPATAEQLSTGPGTSPPKDDQSRIVIVSACVGVMALAIVVALWRRHRRAQAC